MDGAAIDLNDMENEIFDCEQFENKQEIFSFIAEMANCGNGIVPLMYLWVRGKLGPEDTFDLLKINDKNIDLFFKCLTLQ